MYNGQQAVVSKCWKVQVCNHDHREIKDCMPRRCKGEPNTDTRAQSANSHLEKYLGDQICEKGGITESIDKRLPGK